MSGLITKNLGRNFQAAISGLPVDPRDMSASIGGPSLGGEVSNYAAPLLANTGSGLVKNAASGIIYTQPQFFSPIHTPINWQIPSKRKEIYSWSRFYVENEPKVATALEFFSRFPINNYQHECQNRYVKRYFDKLKDKLKLERWLRIISYEVHLLGDCFPFLEVECEHCKGSGQVNGRVCDHDGGSFKRLVILNPEYTEVYSDPLSPETSIAYIPSEELRNLIMKRGPGHDKFSAQIRGMIATGQPIPLDNRNVSHLKYQDNGYNRYGVGMIRRLFPVLAYKTKLMTAQWIVAERLILPIKVVKVGSDERPASANDLAAVQAQMAQTANDPNLTLVTHHNFDLEWYGACHDSETEVLTENGWKKFADVVASEKVMGYDLQTDQMSYQLPLASQAYDYDGTMITFSGKHMDICVTPNHAMLAKTRKWNNDKLKYDHSEWTKIRADQVIESTKFKTTAEWDGAIPQDLPYKKIQKLSHLSLSDYLLFLGYFLSEGGFKLDNGVINAFHISQSEGSDCINDIRRVMHLLSDKVSEHRDERREIANIQFSINDSSFARELVAHTGLKAHDKRIPRWVMDLPKKELAILLNALMAGDGNVRFSLSSLPRFKYTSVSKGLADDVLELTFKLGYNSKIEMEKSENPNQRDIYRVCWACECMESSGGERTVKDRNLGRTEYKGKVYCFTMPTGFLVTRRNGKIGIHGNSGKVLQLTGEFDLINQEILDGLGINKALLNGEGPTYSNAAIGVEVMIDKLETWRSELSEWIEQKIYLPIAMMKGFVEKNEWGELEYVYPKVKWGIMHLRDQQQYRQFILQLHEKGLVSSQRVLETFDIDYDEEVELLRYERAQGALQGGPAPGAAGGLGGGFAGGGGGGGGGMPDLGGLGGMPDISLPPEETGAAGGMAPPAAPGPAASSKVGLVVEAQAQSSNVNISEFGGKILKEKTREKIMRVKEKALKKQQKPADDFSSGGMARDEKGRIMLTSQERMLMKEITQSIRKGDIRQSVISQYPVNYSGTEYTLDFGMPNIKLGVEVDGTIFHSTEEQKQEDRQRDGKLAQLGWTILRFTDREVETRMREVIETIIRAVIRKENWIAERKKT